MPRVEAPAASASSVLVETVDFLGLFTCRPLLAGRRAARSAAVAGSRTKNGRERPSRARGEGTGQHFQQHFQLWRGG